MNPKPKLLLPLVFALAIGTAAFAADVTVQLSNVHLCCNSCVKGADKAVAAVNGATSTCDKDAATVAITAADNVTVQKAVNALVAAGYFGVSNDPAVKVDAASGAKAAKVHSLTVSGVHLCCKKCVTTVNDALGKVPGVTATTAAKDAESFQVTGEFKPTDVFKALHQAGLAGKAEKAE